MDAIGEVMKKKFLFNLLFLRADAGWTLMESV